MYKWYKVEQIEMYVVMDAAQRIVYTTSFPSEAQEKADELNGGDL